MKRGTLASALLAAVVAGCTGDILTVKPTDRVEAGSAITDAVSARAAVASLYDALQAAGNYGEAMITFGELPSDNAYHSGTFSDYATADNNQIKSDNITISNMWRDSYLAISRANMVLDRLPSATYLGAAEKNHLLGEAHFVRALAYHNLVKYFGARVPADSGVPLRLTPVDQPADIGKVTRATVAQVYAQIHADLNQAEPLLDPDVTDAHRGTLGGVRALRARVYLYQGNYAAALAAADSVLGMNRYALAQNYSDLFTALGNDTPEDIFRVRFSNQDAGSVSYYFVAKAFGGRRELAPDFILDVYEPGDLRGAYSIGQDAAGRVYVAKYPSVTGTENIQVIRLAEILLVRAEAQARLGDLAGALATVNPLRVRAGLDPYVLGVTDTMADVLARVAHERQIELAFEGDRWPDMVRTGEVFTWLAGVGAPATQALFPIPQREVDASSGSIGQNPGY